MKRLLCLTEGKSLVDTLSRLYRLGVPPSLLLRGVGLDPEDPVSAVFRKTAQKEINWEHFKHGAERRFISF
jgi:hypothetical protein